MVEQFTQAMLMMAQMFGQMQESQMRLIREELNRLHQISQNLHGLQALLPSPSEARQVIPQTLAGKQVVNNFQNGKEAFPPSSQPASSSGTPATRDGTSATSPRSGGGLQHTPLAPAAGPSQGDVHAVLCEKIAALQQERQGPWQTILQFLGGKTPNKPIVPGE
jgi:hypothetical protein